MDYINIRKLFPQLFYADVDSDLKAALTQYMGMTPDVLTVRDFDARQLAELDAATSKCVIKCGTGTCKNDESA